LIAQGPWLLHENEAVDRLESTTTSCRSNNWFSVLTSTIATGNSVLVGEISVGPNRSSRGRVGLAKIRMGNVETYAEQVFNGVLKFALPVILGL